MFLYLAQQPVNGASRARQSCSRVPTTAAADRSKTTPLSQLDTITIASILQHNIQQYRQIIVFKSHLLLFDRCSLQANVQQSCYPLNTVILLSDTLNH